MKTKILRAYHAIDETVVGQDFEFRELGNPDGFIFGNKAFVFAETVSGERFVHSVSFEVDEVNKADRLAERVVAAGEIDLAHWVEHFPVYGSASWAEAERHEVAKEDAERRGLQFA